MPSHDALGDHPMCALLIFVSKTDLAHEGHYDPFSGGMRYLPPNAHRDRVQDGARVWQRLRGGAASTSAAYSPAGQVEHRVLPKAHFHIGASHSLVGPSCCHLGCLIFCWVSFTGFRGAIDPRPWMEGDRRVQWNENEDNTGHISRRMRVRCFDAVGMPWSGQPRCPHPSKLHVAEQLLVPTLSVLTHHFV